MLYGNYKGSALLYKENYCGVYLNMKAKNRFVF